MVASKGFVIGIGVFLLLLFGFAFVSISITGNTITGFTVKQEATYENELIQVSSEVVPEIINETKINETEERDGS